LKILEKKSLKNKSDILSLILLFIFAIIPLVAGLGYAILYSFGMVGVLNQGFTLQYWKEAFSDQSIPTSFLYSISIAVSSLLLSVTSALLVSLRYYQLLKKGLYTYLINLPLAFPPIVAAFFFFQFLSKGGVVSRTAFHSGIINTMQQFPDLINDIYSIGIIVTHWFLSFPFFLLLFTGLIKTQRLHDLFRVAESLGAHKRQIISKLAIPILIQKSLPNILLYFIFIFGAYEIPVLLGRSHPESVSVLAVRKLQKFNMLDIPQGYVIAIAYTIFVVLFILIFLKQKKLAYAN
jgi:putative spermidine/putrescine transport system permease protein